MQMPRCLRPGITSLMMLAASLAGAQTFPSKPIRMVTTEAGGSGDFAARLIAKTLTRSLGQQVVVDNRSSGVIPGDVVAKAPADGYTLLISASSLWLLPFLQEQVPYHVLRDFAPITAALNTPNILVVHPSMAANSVKDIIALAKAKPGELNYAAGGVGGSAHLAGELFKSMAQVDIVRIPFRGNGPALIGLIGGQVQLMFASAAAVTPHLKSGKLKPIAMTTARASALFPELPTVAASGLPGYEAGALFGVFAPARTPAMLIDQLNGEFVRALSQPEVREPLLVAGAEVVGSSPKELGAMMKSEMTVMGKVIKDARITVN